MCCRCTRLCRAHVCDNGSETSYTDLQINLLLKTVVTDDAEWRPHAADIFSRRRMDQGKLVNKPGKVKLPTSLPNSLDSGPKPR